MFQTRQLDRLYGFFDIYAILKNGTHDNVLELPLKVGDGRFTMKVYIYIYAFPVEG
jgi:hypothetical protein